MIRTLLYGVGATAIVFSGYSILWVIFYQIVILAIFFLVAHFSIPISEKKNSSPDAVETKGRQSVFDFLPDNTRWVMVGRLDLNTSGLLLFTNNGDLANKLMHPSSEIDREYAVRVLGKVEDEHIKKLTNGIELEDGFAKFHRVTLGGGEGANRWYHVVVREGRKREVRRLWEALDFKVSRLIRTRFSDIRLPE